MPYELQAQLQQTWRQVFASVDGTDARRAREIVTAMQKNLEVLKHFAKIERDCVKNSIAAAQFYLSNVGDGVTIRLDDVADLSLAPEAAQEYLRSCVAEHTGLDAEILIQSAVEKLQRWKSRTTAIQLIEALDKGEPSQALIERFRELAPPTVSGSSNREDLGFSMTASEVAAHAAATGGDSLLRISSGFPSLDIACTNPKLGDQLGFGKQGELIVIPAGTGHGKTSFVRPLVTSMAHDLVVGYNMPHAKVVLAFTEETPYMVSLTSRLLPGQKFHYLDKNIQLVELVSSRVRLVKAMYDLVVKAMDEADRLGCDIKEVFPYVLVVDYAGGLAEQGENADTDGMTRTADLLMRGFAAWDLESIEKFGGVNFTEFSGRRWPEGGEGHRMLVLTTAQLRKADKGEFFVPGSSAVTEFCLENSDGTPGWDVQAQDYRIPSRNDMRGSGVLLNHATTQLFLHRSRPLGENSARRLTPEEDARLPEHMRGRLHLKDVRARFLPLKTRNGGVMPFIPMRFDSNAEGTKGQFYDDHAERLLQDGSLRIGNHHIPMDMDVFQQSGDPLLPKRPRRDPFASIRY